MTEPTRQIEVPPASGQSMPLTDADTVDAVGVRNDGGIDLVVSALGPIDDSPATLRLLESKLRNYLSAATSEAFLRHYGQAPGAPVVIYISCAYAIAPAALATIENMRTLAGQGGIGLDMVKQMETSH